MYASQLELTMLYEDVTRQHTFHAALFRSRRAAEWGRQR